MMNVRFLGENVVKTFKDNIDDFVSSLPPEYLEGRNEEAIREFFKLYAKGYPVKIVAGEDFIIYCGISIQYHQVYQQIIPIFFSRTYSNWYVDMEVRSGLSDDTPENIKKALAGANMAAKLFTRCKKMEEVKNLAKNMRLGKTAWKKKM